MADINFLGCDVNVFVVIRVIYSAVMVLLTPLMVMRLLWKSRRLPGYRQRIAERFFIGVKRAQATDVWVHAVSLGEVVAATPFIQHWLEQGLRVLVTTMTPTGLAQIGRRFGDSVTYQYVPYDLPWTLRRFFKRYAPRLGIIMETELWPNLIFEAQRASVPLFLANARISDRAFKKYQRVCWLFKQVLAPFGQILAQSPVDVARFYALGAKPEAVKLLGNIKFDIPIVHRVPAAVRALKQAWGESRCVLIAASTHAGEEESMLRILKQLQDTIDGIILLIAPRHPERFSEVHALCQQHGFTTGKRSDVASINSHIDVVVVDSLGELVSFYAVSDYAFVGGSWVPVGGHNVLEAIAQGVPVFCGDYMQNSQTMTQQLVDAGAISQISDAEALFSALVDLHANRSRCDAQIQCATNVLLANQGAVARHIQVFQHGLNGQMASVA